MSYVPPQGGRKHPQQELIQIDTTNILFICGGAFTGIENIIMARNDQNSIGFGASIKSKNDLRNSNILEDLEAEDLVKFGMIPEFIGRLPVITTLQDLDQKALISILTKPQNAIIKQYKKLFEFNDVSLKFTECALEAIADTALQKKNGARGLRSIIEEILLDNMYNFSELQGKEVIYNRLAVEDHAKFRIKSKKNSKILNTNEKKSSKSQLAV